MAILNLGHSQSGKHKLPVNMRLILNIPENPHIQLQTETVSYDLRLITPENIPRVTVRNIRYGLEPPTLQKGIRALSQNRPWHTL